uniref:Uncharacterized protein n=1 Tax=Brugia malayi TaxID=6279 RepID=A0A8L7YIM1_BRUMA
MEEKKKKFAVLADFIALLV